MRTSQSDNDLVENHFRHRAGGKVEDVLVDFSADQVANNIRPMVAEFNKKKLLHLMNTLVGVEVEAEAACKYSHPFWIVDIDRSLRGENAYEFKTKYGYRIYDILPAVRSLCALATKAEFSFSERTSIHIHIDVRRMRLKQIRSLVKLYLLFEDALFKFAGEWRKDNIFCVPLSMSANLETAHYLEMVEFILQYDKYSAMNLKAIHSFGTIEFRHMEGNADCDRICAWILMLACLAHAAYYFSESTVDSMIRSLRCDSQFEQVAVKIFGSALSKKLLFDPKKMLEATTQAKLFVASY